MPIRTAGARDFQRNELLNPRIGNFSSAPASPGAAKGLLYFDTTLNQLGVWNGTGWVYVGAASPDATSSVKGLIQLAGDLGGSGSTAAAPIISNGAITLAKVAGALKPSGASGTAATTDYALRKLGTGADDAAAGNDARLTDTRVSPANSVTSAQIVDATIVNADISTTAAIAYSKLALSASIVNADIATTAAIAESKLALASDAAVGTASRRTLGTGALQAAAGNDARLSDLRSHRAVTDVFTANLAALSGTGTRPTTATGVTLSGTYFGRTFLLTAQTDPATNGPYLYTDNGTNWSLTAIPVTHALGESYYSLLGNRWYSTVNDLYTFVAQATAFDRSTHTGTQLAATISDLNTAVRLNRLDQMASPAGPLDFGSFGINNSGRIYLTSGLETPVSALELASKAYVDSVAQGLDAKQSVLLATTGNIAYTSGYSGGTFGTAVTAVDGVAIPDNARILVKDQTNPAHNGVYLVPNAAAGAWFRTGDMDTWSEVPGAFVFVEKGTVNADSGWVSTADQGGTLGTTAITWVQFSGAGQIDAGAGLTKIGNQINIGTFGTSGIIVDTDQISIDVSRVARKEAPWTWAGNGAATTFTGNIGFLQNLPPRSVLFYTSTDGQTFAPIEPDWSVFTAGPVDTPTFTVNVTPALPSGTTLYCFYTV